MHSSLLLLLLCLPLMANALSKEDTDYVQKVRKQYRSELWDFLGEIKIFPQLKKIHDDFFACKADADQTSTALLNVLPTFYPSVDQRDRNLAALSAILVMIDSLKEARECKPIVVLKKKSRMDCYPKRCPPF